MSEKSSTNKNTGDVVIDVCGNTKDGQLKCPACGASEMIPNPKTGKLRCNYCYTEFEGHKIKQDLDLFSLKGRVVGSGAVNINKDASSMVTLKCGGCGAEIVIDTSDAPHARCHWCRSVLSINSKMENGSIPDVILPFSVRKEEAQNKINDFVKKRGFYANKQFKKEFSTDNIMGVYFPYMLVDANCHATFKGEGEHLIREYTVREGDSNTTYYDADAYSVERDFDIVVDDLSIESNSKRADKNDNSATNNIINSIMPFDTYNCIEYQSNYLIGYTSERRDVNIDDLSNKAKLQVLDIARHSINQDLSFYDRGVSWKNINVDIKGSKWISAYLPVWLYSYLETKGSKKVIHYVAVNARTMETMGSVPVNIPLLFLVSAIIEIISIILGFSFCIASDEEISSIFIFLLPGILYFVFIYARYRNQSARHVYERETKNQISNIQRVDSLIGRRNRLSSNIIRGKNNNKLEGDTK